MLQAHSFLWHYLWVAPNLFLLILAFLAWRRGLAARYPVFLIFAIAIPLEQFTLYAADLIPSVTPTAWWRLLWAGLVVEALIKFALIGEIFGALLDRYPALAKLGRLLISGVGAALVLLAVVAGAYTTKNNIYWIVAGAHILEQGIFIIESGVILFIVLFAAYFKLPWSRLSFGITLGLGISACVHLATWALMASAGLPTRYRDPLNFLNMGIYHVCILIWFYYLLVPQKSVVTSVVPLPNHSLEVWNQQLERLLHP